MNGIKLQQKSWGRRRFVKVPLQGALESWEEVVLATRELILTKTNLQPIGPKGTIEVENGVFHILIEVLGLPVNDLQLVDSGPVTTYQYLYPTGVFEADFPEILKKAGEITARMSSTLAPGFHIVIDGHKIALHFFRQKDYSQH